MDKNLTLKKYLDAVALFLKVESSPQQLERIFPLFPKTIQEKENDPMFFYHQDRWFLAVQMLEEWGSENNWFYDVDDAKLVDILDDLPEHFAIGVEDNMSREKQKEWVDVLENIYIKAVK